MRGSPTVKKLKSFRERANWEANRSSPYAFVPRHGSALEHLFFRWQVEAPGLRIFSRLCGWVQLRCRVRNNALFDFRLILAANK